MIVCGTPIGRCYSPKTCRADQGTARFPDAYLHRDPRLKPLGPRTRHFSWAKAWTLVREPDAGNLALRFDEREAEAARRG